MKKTFLLILSLLAGAWMAFGQYVPTTSWPYVYDEFQEGALIWTGGKEKGDPHTTVGVTILLEVVLQVLLFKLSGQIFCWQSAAAAPSIRQKQ